MYTQFNTLVIPVKITVETSFSYKCVAENGKKTMKIDRIGITYTIGLTNQCGCYTPVLETYNLQLSTFTFLLLTQILSLHIRSEV